MRITLDGAVLRAGRSKQLIGPLNAVLTRGMNAVIGLNGSGKSTLLHALSSAYKLSRGHIDYEREGELLSPFEVKLTMGYVPQEISLYEDMTLELYLRYIAELKCIEYAAIADEIVRVTVLLGLEHAGKRPLRELSEGQQRRAMIAQALLGRPSFLIMDEPYVGLDLEQRRSIHCFLQEYAEHAVVVVATHFIEEFRDGDYDQILVLPNNS